MTTKAYVIKQIGNIEEMVNRLETFKDAQQKKYDDMSETRQESAKGEKLYEQLEALDAAISALEDAKDSLAVFQEE